MGKAKQITLVNTALQNRLIDAIQSSIALKSDFLPTGPLNGVIVGYRIHPIEIKRKKYALSTYLVKAMLTNMGTNKVDEREVEVLMQEPLSELLEVGTVLSLHVSRYGNYDVFTY